MKKTLKLSLTLVLAFVMLFAIAIIASAEAQPTASGDCSGNNANLTWSYYQDTKTLVISGTGRMATYGAPIYVPWNKYCDEVENIVIEEGVVSIGKNAFRNFSKITDIVFPDSLKEIYQYAFMRSSVKNVYFGKNINQVYYYAFMGCSIENVYITDLTNWCQCTFGEKASNPSAMMPSSAWNFYVNGEKLTDLVVPEEVEDIGSYAFYKSALKSVTLGPNVKSIGTCAFNFNNYLTTLTMGDKPVSFGTKSVSEMNRFQTINVPNFAAWAGSTFAAGGNPLRTSTGRANRFTLTIGDVRLANTDAIENLGLETEYTLVVPENVTTIAANTFFRRKNLRSIYIPSSVTSINGDTAGARNQGAFYLANLLHVYGEEGSYAQTFAENNGYRFNAITPVEVEGIELDKETEEVAIGSSTTLTATVAPADATFNQVLWNSSDPDVAYVVNGKVTAIAGGTTTITASTSNGAYTDTCVITVPGVAVEGIELDQATATVEAGHTLKLVATITPANATNKNVIWTSSNDEIAKVVDGVVTPVSNGTVTITATTEDGDFEATCEVTAVFPVINVTGVVLDVTGAVLEINETLQLNAIVEPADADNKDVVWSTEDDTVATVVDGLVTAVGAGQTNIVVTTVDGEKTAKCAITVNEPIPDDVPVEEIALDVEELQIVFGETYQFEVIFTPDNTTQKNLFWESTNEDVATIDENGLLTAIEPGITIVTVISEDNEDLYAECYVEVTSGFAVEGIALNKTSANVYLGDIVNLEVTFTPANATNKNVTWESSNEEIVTVDNGVVTAVGGGVATVTVTSEDGEFTATCKFIVAVGNETPPIEWGSNE